MTVYFNGVYVELSSYGLSASREQWLRCGLHVRSAFPESVCEDDTCNSQMSLTHEMFDIQQLPVWDISAVCAIAFLLALILGGCIS